MPNEQMNESGQNLTLSEKQLKAIPLILGATSITEGVKSARISKTTFYEWLKDPLFKSEYDRQRKESITLALDELKGLTGEAVKVLRALLKSKKEGVKLRTATAILDHVGRFIEFGEIEDRLTAIERRLSDEKY